MAYPQPSSFMSPAPLSAWFVQRRGGSRPQMCAGSGWEILADLQSVLGERLVSLGALPSFDGQPTQLGDVVSNEVRGVPVGWSVGILRALYALGARDGVPSGYLDAVREDATRGFGPVSAATAALGIWMAELSYAIDDNADRVYGQGSPAEVELPLGTALPSIDVPPPRVASSTTTSGAQCNVAPAEASNLAVLPTPRQGVNALLLAGLVLGGVVAAVAFGSTLPLAQDRS